MRWDMNAFRLIAVALLLLTVGCARTPSPKTLAGEWRQDMDYLQSDGLLDQLAEVIEFEEYELYFSDGRVAVSRLVGKDPARERVYWDSPVSFSRTASGEYEMLFSNFEQQPAVATVAFEGKHLIVKIGERRMGFLRDRAENLRNKGYVPKK